MDQQQQAALKQGAIKMTSSAIVKSSAEAASYQSIDFFSSLIRLGANLSLAITNVLSQKKRQKKKEKLEAAKATSSNVINLVLNDVYEYGLSLIDQTDISPADPQFDVMLSGLISELTGYRGKCEADVFLPETRAIWFKVRDGKVIPEPGITLPDNADTLWRVGCRNLQDRWMIAYQEKKLAQKREGEMQTVKSAHNFNTWGLRIGFGILIAALGAYLLHSMIQTARLR